MVVPNMIIQSTRSGAKAKVIFVNTSANVVQIEYLNPTLPNYKGTHTLTMNDIKHYWAEIGIDTEDEKTISLTSHLKSQKTCSHQWRSYQGLRESFRYCVHCDKKEY